MQLCKAISEAGSEDAVFFLTTAYIEALQHASCASALPLQLTIMPLKGIRDLRRRFDALHVLIAVHYSRTHATRSELEEAHEVFATALQRLCALNAGEDSETVCAQHGGV
jgi:hypothetical protein